MINIREWLRDKWRAQIKTEVQRKHESSRSKLKRAPVYEMRAGDVERFIKERRK